jgi:fructose-specific phosphotransferase system component IIB
VSTVSARIADLAARSSSVSVKAEPSGSRARSPVSCADVIDAALVLLAADGDCILTSEPKDLEPLAFAAGLQIEIIPV